VILSRISSLVMDILRGCSVRSEIIVLIVRHAVFVQAMTKRTVEQQEMKDAIVGDALHPRRSFSAGRRVNFLASVYTGK
jgi:hypothetical protein